MGVQDVGDENLCHPPLPSFLYPSEAQPLCSWRCCIRWSRQGRNFPYLCGILLFSTILITMAPIFLPSLFLLFTLSRKHRLSVCLQICFLPFPVLPHPCLSHQLPFLTSATFLSVPSAPLHVSCFSCTQGRVTGQVKIAISM